MLVCGISCQGKPLLPCFYCPPSMIFWEQTMIGQQEWMKKLSSFSSLGRVAAEIVIWWFTPSLKAWFECPDTVFNYCFNYLLNICTSSLIKSRQLNFETSVCGTSDFSKKRLTIEAKEIKQCKYFGLKTFFILRTNAWFFEHNELRCISHITTPDWS